MRSAVESNTICMARFNAPDTTTADGTTKITVNPEKTADNKGFFGPDGPSFRDVLDAVNPLNHIPIVSDIFQAATGHTPSTASQLAGGAMFGPIGFMASLVNVIFEQQTGKGAVGSMYAALTDDTPATTQLADAGVPPSAEATNAAAPTMEVAMADTTPAATQTLAAQTTQSARDKALLDLYGASAPSAHRSYQKAQLLPYLKDVNKSQVI